MTNHEIISAAETPCGNVVMKIRWNDTGHVTQSIYPVEAAKALGWTCPDPQPVDPAWMVEVAREGCAIDAETLNHHGISPDNYRSGAYDDTGAFRSSINALRLALSRGHVVLAPVMPSEEEMLKGARKDTAHMYRDRSMLVMAEEVLSGVRDDGIGVSAALQARRSVYASLGAVVKAVSSGPVVPDVDQARALSSAWHYGYASARAALGKIMEGAEINSAYYDDAREKDVSAILENLKSGEA